MIPCDSKTIGEIAKGYHSRGISVRCFGGDLDGRTIELIESVIRYGAFDHLIPGPGMNATKQRYTLHKGEAHSRDVRWYFAALEGMEPTDDMAQQSEPAGNVRDWGQQ